MIDMALEEILGFEPFLLAHFRYYIYDEPCEGWYWGA